MESDTTSFISNFSTTSSRSLSRTPKFETLKLFDDPHCSYEAGCDEAGRGCLMGRVYAAAVILPKNEADFGDEIYKHIRDSKKIAREKRKILAEYIKEKAVSYAVCFAEHDEIDDKNILQATMRCMHSALSELSVEPEGLLIDGSYFKAFENKAGMKVPFRLIEGGDNKYLSIAAASILAKVAHDEYINELCDEYPELEKYDLRSNMGYGTASHMAAIREHGITPFHRLSFGPNKSSSKSS